MSVSETFPVQCCLLRKYKFSTPYSLESALSSPSFLETQLLFYQISIINQIAMIRLVHSTTNSHINICTISYNNYCYY